MKKQRFRLFFSKTEQMRFTGHLDLILTWERTFRRADLPLAYSQGFSPRPILTLAAPLPLGFTSVAEIGDFWLSEIISREDLLSRLQDCTPPGILVQDGYAVEDLHRFKLPSLVTAAEYTVTLQSPTDGLNKSCSNLLLKDTLPRVRKKKSYDLRPLILALEPLNSSVLKMTLGIFPHATGRPDEVLAELEIPPHQTAISRTKLILKENGGS